MLNCVKNKKSSASLPNSERVFECVLNIEEVWQSLLNYQKVCQKSRKYEKICAKVRKFADSWESTLSFLSIRKWAKYLESLLNDERKCEKVQEGMRKQTKS